MAIILLFESWNEGVPGYNGQVEDTEIRSYTISHKFNQPSEAVIVIYDPDGTKIQKFNADVNDTYIGSGKVTLQLAGGTIWYGRIKRVVGNSADRTITLECKDWLDQLDDELITYDMREKLGTTDLRQSVLRSDVDGDRIPVENNGGVFSVFDDGAYDDDGGMAFVNDAYNGMKLFLNTGMAGTQTWRFHPYDSTATDHDVYGDDPEALWVENNTVDSGFANNNWTLEYHFHVELGENTVSSFYVDDSITGARIIVVYKMTVAAGNTATVEFYENDGPAWIDLHALEEDPLFHKDVLEIPTNYLADVVDNTGEFNVRFDITRAGGNATISIQYLAVEIDATTTGYGTGITINDTINPNELEIATDPTAAATQLWEGVPYCIAKPIYLHLESATGPIGGGDKVRTLTYGAGDIENTSGYSTTQFKNKSRLDILKALARQDKSMFWIAIHTTTVTYQQTFGADTEQLTDADVESWTSIYDYDTMFNSVDVYGARIGDAEIYAQGTNAASQTTFKTQKTKVLKNAGLVSFAEAEDLADALAASDSTLRQQVSCTIKGLDVARVLGTVVEITSSYLWPTAAKDYIVTGWSYDSSTDMTSLLLHPKVSIGLQELRTGGTEQEKIDYTVDRADADSFVPDPVTHEVA